MNYEEKYNDLLLRIKSMADVQPDVTRMAIESLFPELKESEDERIRQFLIQEVTETSDEIMSYRNMNKEDVLAWLEKQGEHANFCNKIQIGDKVTRNEDGMLVNLSQLKRVAKKDEKQGEQKPKFRIGDTIKKKSTGDIVTISEVDIKNKEYRLTNTGFIPFEYESLWQLVEQKSAWSEEDEDVINHLLAICAGAKRYRRQFAGCLQEDITKYQTWLKSLKPQNHWKPSEEQMEALLYEVNAWDEDSVNGQNLKSLYQDLKKLK